MDPDISEKTSDLADDLWKKLPDSTAVSALTLHISSMRMSELS